jgi:DNA-3-methyladenine glycosylase I
MPPKLQRCWNTDDPLRISYHDEEWGIPLHDDSKFFEFLVLGGFQAGLTWWLILQRRDAFRQAFDNFKPEVVAAYTSNDVERLMKAPGIIRNKMKILAAINNGRCFVKVQQEFGSFDSFIWSFVGITIHNSFSRVDDLPTETEESKRMSNSLRQRGFQFVGPTICYAFMQATGMVNDHLITCFRHEELKKRSSINCF